LLIAATGSGKTLAYFLPALSRACDGGDGEDGNDGGRKRRRTVLIVAPTRELSAQLARDASLLLPDDDGDGAIPSRVVLAVRGIPPPTPAQLGRATVLIGTPNELHAVLTRISGAQSFLAGDALSGVILDEVDVLLPPPPQGVAHLVRREQERRPTGEEEIGTASKAARGATTRGRLPRWI